MFFRIIMITIGVLALANIVWELTSYSEVYVWKDRYLQDSDLEIRLIVKPWGNDKMWMIPYGLLFPRAIFQQRRLPEQKWTYITSQRYKETTNTSDLRLDNLTGAIMFGKDGFIEIWFDRLHAESSDNGETWKVEVDR